MTDRSTDLVPQGSIPQVLEDKKEQEATRVDHSQYVARSGTAAGNEAAPTPVQQVIDRWACYRNQSVRYFNTPTPEQVAFNDRVRLCENKLIDLFIRDLTALSNQP